MLNGFVTAMRTLTILPVPGRDAEDFSRALPWFPVVGALLGFILFGIATLAARLIPVPWPQGMAVLLVIAGSLLTRALHLDGLSDWADGFGGAHDKENTLRIMKDHAMGVFGGTTLICVLLTKWICFTRLLETGAVFLIPMAYIISRTGQVYLAVHYPYARSENGTAAPFIRGAKRIHLEIAIALALGILFLLYAFPYGRCTVLLLPLLAGSLIPLLFGAWCNRRVGGITGDLLGACSELTETSLLLILAVMK